MKRAKVAVLISGKGTNMAALLYASRQAGAAYNIVLVASNDPEAEGLRLAEAEGVETFALSHRGISRADHDAAMDCAVREAGAEYIALAGYMRILGTEFVSRWEGRMLNVHPSLLPKYPGLDTHARAIEAGDAHAGASVHLVTDDLDMGEVLGRAEVAILPGDTAETLAERVKLAEHQLYPRVLSEYAARPFDPTWLVARVRERAMALPEAEETLSHGMPCFGIVKGKKFAWVSVDHHGDGITALLAKISGADEQAQLIENDPARYYRPPYFGDGWIGIRLDLGDTDWASVEDWLSRSWRAVAPKRLTSLMDAADQF
ncbi:phosphoribosylglycinamide formyltransferase [Pelagerythrobacter aerophilus]|uniref:Phosphoribosylglycinamide formyltransferase n=1 Tax=Pelagerythrobacter aerophilus TaxID=2306995 RepID=A0A418NFX3_9SPHN|nr:phosphoribosylglycinamide formyltransferase [Pelagerythrobacter aerophilus]RIV76763.1 phosphoribosylglycinamide formyltransferase [Pelagerythrobacter aerophilus]